MSSHEPLLFSTHKIGNVLFELLPEKALYWPATQSLILGDLHLGKAAHFNKAGINIPQQAVESKNFEVLTSLMCRHQPQRVFFLGDLFHSEWNATWDQLIENLDAWPTCKFYLVQGNHDILEMEKYHAAGLIVVEEWLEDGILLTHEPLEQMEHGLYNICGHIHPGVRLIGKGRQTLRLPCYIFGKHQGVLPAFGKFTGLATMKPCKSDQVYVIYDGVVKKM